jgi:hypothetical protein
MQKKFEGQGLGEYAEIFGIMNRLTEEHPGGLDEPFPGNWQDPLELYGCFSQSLKGRAVDLEKERAAVRRLMAEDHLSPATIWHARVNLVAQRLFENGRNGS